MGCWSSSIDTSSHLRALIGSSTDAQTAAIDTNEIWLLLLSILLSICVVGMTPF